MFRKKRVFYIMICLCVVLSVIAVTAIVSHIQNQRSAEDIYFSVRTAVLETLSDDAIYEYAVFCFRDENGHYLVLYNADKHLSALKTLDGQKTYYVNGRCWTESTDGVLSDAGMCEDPVYPHLKETLTQLISQENVTYSYKKATGRQGLPFWIYLNDTYLECLRPGYEEFLERMTIHVETDWECIRWYILESGQVSEKRDDARVFAHVCSAQGVHGGYYIKDIWGTLPEEILKQIGLKNKDASA